MKKPCETSRFFRTWPAVVLLTLLLGGVSPTGAAHTSTPLAPNTSWAQVQGDAQHSGYVSQTLGPPYSVLWRRDTPPVSARVQPVIAAGLVFLPSNDGCLYALSTSDGHTAWSYCTGGALVNSAAYDGGRVFFGSTDHHIYSVNADGSLAWRYETGSTVKTAPVVAEGRVFAGSSDGTMYALDETNGAVAWRYSTGAPIYDTAAYDNGRIFFGGMDSAGYALDAGAGALAWRVPIPGQGFRDRWTVAGNGYVYFAPMLQLSHHDALGPGTFLFRADTNPVIYNQPWETQRQAILNHLADNPFQQPLFVVNAISGTLAPTPAVLYASGGSQSPHAQVVLLPNGNANVIYRRSFGEPAEWGATTHDALYTGELDPHTGDIAPIDHCHPGTGGWADCGDYKSAHTSDESSALVRSGNVLYLDIARGTYGLDTASATMLPTVACYSDGMGTPFYVGSDCLITYTDYLPPPAGWRVHYDDIHSEVPSDGNDVKRPTPIVGNVMYVFHYNHLAAVEGTIAGQAPPSRSAPARLTSGRAGAATSTAAPSYDPIDFARQELELRVTEMIGAGHMAPTLYMAGVGGSSHQLGEPAYFYMTPNETIYALSAAYPHLSPALQTQLKVYLDAEMDAHPPHTRAYYPPHCCTLDDLAGTRREYFAINPDQAFNAWPPPIVHVSTLYSLWLYSNNTGDWTFVTDNYAALQALYANFKTQSGSTIASYPEWAGVLGFARIAQHLGQTADHDDAWAFAQQGLTAGADFNAFLATARTRYENGNSHSYTTSIFRFTHCYNSTTSQYTFNCNPAAFHFDRDIGALLRQHVAADVAAYVAEIEDDVPLWWLSDVAISHGENAYATPEIAWTAFMLHAYVLDASPEQLARYLDAPNRRGDLLHIQKLVAVLELLTPADLSASSKEASTSTPRPGETVTYTLVVRNSGEPFTATARLTDTLPPELSYVPGTFTATLGLPDASVPYLLRWTGWLSDTSAITLSYAVTVDIPSGQARPISNTVTIEAGPYGLITRTATVIAGGQAVYLPMILKGG